MHVQVYLLECSLLAKAIDLLAGSQIWRPREREREREKEGGSKRGRVTGEKRAQDKDLERVFRGERMSCDQV